METGQFHTHDGWYWNRTADGSVRIVVQPPGGGSYEHVLTASEWASVVSHVSARGETGETWKAALEFHG